MADVDERERRRALEILVSSDGWKEVLRHVLEKQILLDAQNMSWELTPEMRAHASSQRFGLMQLVKWVYREAQVPHPWDEALEALYGRIARQQRQPAQMREPSIKDTAAIIRQRREAGRVA
jgi:hypothetical protein